MLQFDEFGYLTPDINIPSTMDELERIFKIDDHRAELFEKYLTYTKNLKSAIGNKSFKQWIEGSFVTKNNTPK